MRYKDYHMCNVIVTLYSNSPEAKDAPGILTPNDKSLDNHYFPSCVYIDSVILFKTDTSPISLDV